MKEGIEMKEVIAINNSEFLRIIKCDGIYTLESREQQSFLPHWKYEDSTEQEWIAVKWIQDYKMRVSSEYPTIAEIRESQNK